MRIKTIKIDLPVYYAMYLFYGDSTDLNDEDITECARIHQLGMPVDCGDESKYMRYNRLLTECVEYTFINRGK